MACLVIGFGSIGQRHKEVLEGLGKQVSVVSRREGLGAYSDLEQAFIASSPKYIVIATETSDHASQLSNIDKLGFTGTVLIEKPIAIDVRGLIKPKGFTLIIGYNLRFHPLLKHFRNDIQNDKIVCARLYAGQHLSSWRKGSDGKSSYSGYISQGGGVLRDLSHELDLMVWLFGDCVNVSAIGGKYTDVTIDSDDSFSLLCSTHNVPAVTINVNYLDRIGRRSIEVIGEKNTYILDLIENNYFRNKELISSSVIERNDTYKTMHKRALENDFQDHCSWNDALKVMSIIDSAELSSQENFKTINIGKDNV